VDESLAAPLVRAIEELRPDVVVVSGDLTQRARSREFLAARKFLDLLPGPQIVVPGNHDVPLHNLYARFRLGLHGYCEYITEDLEPFFRDAEVAILGISTARSLTFKGGRISHDQILRIEEKFAHQAKSVTKILVTHHPFDLPEVYGGKHLVGRAELAIARLASAGVDVLLAGHMHVSHSGQTAARYGASGHSAIFVQAGTALSTRSRGEENSFNAIRIDGNRISIERYSWRIEACAFALQRSEEFRRSESGWSRAAAT
jgi:3',5'-cyclic AMP phosphodiesterase CpdA